MRFSVARAHITDKHMLRSSASRIISEMRPYSEAVCIVMRSQKIGIARSDPYLSSASALSDIDVRRGRIGAKLQHALKDIPVGALFFGLPMQGFGSDDHHGQLIRQRRTIARVVSKLHKLGTTRTWLIPYCLRDRRVSILEARKEQRENEQWDAVGLIGHAGSASASIHAAVALQDLLDEETGGWPNTFG